jgi:rare lipoprotein A
MFGAPAMRIFHSTRMAPAIVGLLALLAVAAQTVHASSARAASVATWSHRVAGDQRHLARLARDIRDTSAQIQRDEAGLAKAGVVVSRRLSAIYEAGGGDPLDHVDHMVVSGMSVSRAADAADAIEAVTRQDRRVLDRYRAIARNLPRLRKDLRELRADQRATQRRLAQHRRKLQAARAAAARARAAALAAAARLAATPDSPLANEAVSPETIAAVTAGASSPPRASGSTLSGVASIYSNGLAGKPTSTGEPYNPGAMTAASPSLPLGSWVTVTGPGGSAIVRINDRGPFVGGRILDLSAAAAAAIGLPGIGNVTITVH